MAEFFNEYGALLWEGTLETLYMTLFATLFAYVLGLPMGVLLTVTKAGGVAPAPRFNAVFGWLVNLLRSLPFIILMFFIIPFTRLLVGTSIGATAALVPLTLSAAPFIARMVEQSLEEIDTGVIEAAQCMGATRWQIVTRVLLVESVPSLLGCPSALSPFWAIRPSPAAWARGAWATWRSASAISGTRNPSCTPPCCC